MSLTIKTYDNIDITFDTEVLKLSGTIQTMLEAIESDETTIPLYNSMCTASNITQIKIFLDYIHANPLELERLNEFNTNRGTSPISQWLLDYTKMPNDLICNLVIIADYLDIKCLLELLCYTLANKIRECSPEEITQMFSKIN